MHVTIYKLRVSDRLQANKSGEVSISEPHEKGVPLVPTKKLWICTKHVSGPDRGWGVRTPGPHPASYAPELTRPHHDECAG